MKMKKTWRKKKLIMNKTKIRMTKKIKNKMMMLKVKMNKIMKTRIKIKEIEIQLDLA